MIPAQSPVQTKGRTDSAAQKWVAGWRATSGITTVRCMHGLMQAADLSNGVAQCVGRRAAGCNLPDARNELLTRLQTGACFLVQVQLCCDWWHWCTLINLRATHMGHTHDCRAHVECRGAHPTSRATRGR